MPAAENGEARSVKENVPQTHHANHKRESQATKKSFFPWRKAFFASFPALAFACAEKIRPTHEKEGQPDESWQKNNKKFRVVNDAHAEQPCRKAETSRSETRLCHFQPPAPHRDTAVGQRLCRQIETVAAVLSEQFQPREKILHEPKFRPQFCNRFHGRHYSAFLNKKTRPQKNGRALLLPKKNYFGCLTTRR